VDLVLADVRELLPVLVRGAVDEHGGVRLWPE
jgi:hypothetical protein